MPVTVFAEAADSRAFNLGGSSPTATLKYMALRSDDEGEILAAIIANSPAVFSGLYRQGTTATPLGGGVWTVDVEYSIPSDGSNQDTLPAQGDPDDPAPNQPDPDLTEPLGPEYSFTTIGGTRRVYQSYEQKDSVGRNGDPPPIFDGSINVTKDGVEGTDVEEGVLQWSITRTFESITHEYLDTLADLTPCINGSAFWGREAGELKFLGAEGQGKAGGGFTVTFRFAEKKNQVNVKISDDITVPAVRGWDYLWVQYVDEVSEGVTVKVPYSAHVERVYHERDLKRLGI